MPLLLKILQYLTEVSTLEGDYCFIQWSALTHVPCQTKIENFWFSKIQNREFFSENNGSRSKATKNNCNATLADLNLLDSATMKCFSGSVEEGRSMQMFSMKGKYVTKLVILHSSLLLKSTESRQQRIQPWEQQPATLFHYS